MQKKKEVGYQRLDGLFSDEGKGKKKKEAWAINKFLPAAPNLQQL